MSDDKRRRRRVQGGWAVPSGSSVPQNATTNRPRKTPVTNTNFAGDFGNHGQFQGQVANFKFQDPKVLKIAKLKPRNFSWLIPGVLAGSALPSGPEQLQYMVEDGVKHLVSLTERKPSLRVCSGLNHIHVPVKEFCPPTLHQAIEFVSFVENAQEKQEGVAVHCQVGRGRTGTMLACYLVKSQGLSAHDAISMVRRHRPRSIETYEQEQLVEHYAKHLKNNQDDMR